MNFWQRILARFQQPGETRIFVPSRQAGVFVSEDSALTYAAVWACVRVIAETVASLPWHVYRRAPTGREQVDNWVSWMLNGQANSEMTAYAVRETLLGHALTWGNGYAEIIRDAAGRASELWPMTPDRVTPKRDENTGRLYYEDSQPGGPPRRLEPANVFHLHGLGFDGAMGYSPVRMAARSIGLGIAQDTFGQSFYSNGTVFGGMVEVPRTMKPEQIAVQEAYLNEQHRGPDKAFRVRIMGEGMKYHNASMPMTDAQFLESRRFSVTEVARWFRVPPHKIADLERSTNNNIEHQGIEFVTDTIVPWVTRLEQEANVKLIGPRSQGAVYTKFALQALMRGDAKSRAEYFRTMTQIGAMSINEVRTLEELNSIGEAGDEHLVQLNQTTLERLVEEPPEPKPKNEPAEPAAESSEPQDNAIRRGALAFIRGGQA